MRVVLGQLWQETNTLNPNPTTREDFERMGVVRREDFLEKLAGVNELGGMIDGLRSWERAPELAGTIRLPAWPSGRATAETFDWLLGSFLEEFRAALPADAVLLGLHGAMVADEHPDVEGELLEAVRREVGAEVPVVATLDLHVHLTEKMVRSADALVLYHTMPHVDVRETGLRGAEVLRRIVREGARPVTAFQKIPMVVPAERSSTEAESGVAVDMKRRLKELEAEAKVLAAGVAPVQPWLDVPDLGTAVLVVTDGDAELAREACASLAEELWERRREYLPELTDLSEAVREAHETAEGLVVISDSADATTSGAPGDSGWLLAEMVRYEWPRPALATIVAPEAVEAAREAGEGATVKLRLGGRRDTRFGTSVELEAGVERLFDARFTMTGHIGSNMRIDMGPAAVLRRGNLYVVATTHNGPHYAPELFEAAGLDPFAAQLLVAKSPCGFRAAYEGRAAKIFNVRAPGCAPSDFWNYEYRNITRPLWPWDEIEAFRAEPLVRGPV